jgi:hypothetical protein
MKLGRQGESDLRRAHVHDFSQGIVLAGTDVRYLSCYHLMNGEDVGHLDVDSGLRLGIEVVEFVNLEVALGLRYGNNCSSISK